MLARMLNRLLSAVGLRIVSSASGLVNASDELERRIYSICHEADERGLDALTAPQRAVVLAWGSRGIIGNGGFEYFYEGEWRMAELAEAYRALGFSDAADACERSLEVFPEREPPRDTTQRGSFLNTESKAFFKDLEKLVFRIQWDALKLAIGHYIESRPDEFRKFK